MDADMAADAESTGAAPRPPDRQGPFWDFVAGRIPPPPAATTLGWQLREVDPERGTIETSFEAGEGFLNPIGSIQGGFLAAMLDDTLGPALVATLEPGWFAPTLDLQVQYHRPARPGRLIGRGSVAHRTRDIAYLRGELVDEDDRVVATATATALIKRMPLAGDRPAER